MSSVVRFLPSVRLVAELVGEVVTSPTPNRIEHVVEVWTTPDRIVLQPMVWEFPGGQAQHCEPDGPARVVLLSEVGTLERALGPALCGFVDPRALQAFEDQVQRRAGAGSDEWLRCVFSVFLARLSKGVEHRVEPKEADYFELGFSTRYPVFTLRLGRSHDELVMDHGWSSRSEVLERTIDVHEVLDCTKPDDAARVEAVFGADVRRVAEWFAANRNAAFKGDKP